MCNMEEVKRRLGEIEQTLDKLKQTQLDIKAINLKLKELDASDIDIVRQNVDILNDVSRLLREQGRNNLETSRLLSDLSGEVAGVVFELQEIKAWQKNIFSHDADWVSEHRAEQSKLVYRSLRDHFNKNELEELIMNLGINLSLVSGESVAEKALWLVEFSRRTGMFWKMVKECRSLRPKALWPVETGFIGE